LCIDLAQTQQEAWQAQFLSFRGMQGA